MRSQVKLKTCIRFPADMGLLRSRESGDQREASELKDEVLNCHFIMYFDLFI